MSDGTPAGTGMIQDLAPGAASADPSNFTPVGTAVFFNAETLTTGRELWAMEVPYHEVYIPLMRR
jgi:hypothetical protein